MNDIKGKRSMTRDRITKSLYKREKYFRNHLSFVLWYTTEKNKIQVPSEDQILFVKVMSVKRDRIQR
jgi:hypothetical protein